MAFYKISDTLSLNGAAALSNSDFQRALYFTFHDGMKSSIISVVLLWTNLCMHTLYLEFCSIYLALTAIPLMKVWKFLTLNLCLLFFKGTFCFFVLFCSVLFCCCFFFIRNFGEVARLCHFYFFTLNIKKLVTSLTADCKWLFFKVNIYQTEQKTIWILYLSLLWQQYDKMASIL